MLLLFSLLRRFTAESELTKPSRFYDHMQYYPLFSQMYCTRTNHTITNESNKQNKNCFALLHSFSLLLTSVDCHDCCCIVFSSLNLQGTECVITVCKLGLWKQSSSHIFPCLLHFHLLQNVVYLVRTPLCFPIPCLNYVNEYTMCWFNKHPHLLCQYQNLGWNWILAKNQGYFTRKDNHDRWHPAKFSMLPIMFTVKLCFSPL
jgi:hypothetical protein